MSGYICRCAGRQESEREWYPNCFGQVWLFEGLSPEVWQDVAPSLIRRDLEAGEDLFRQGDTAESMYMIKSGTVKLWKVFEDGRSMTLDIWKHGDLVGEGVLVDEGEYPVTATCMTPTKTCGIDRVTFERLVENHPGFALVAVRNLARRVQYLTGRLDTLSEPSLEERLHKVLINVAKQVGSPATGGWNISFPLSHEEIGFLAGAHRVSVTRAMGKLRSSGRIQTGSQTIFVAETAL